MTRERYLQCRRNHNRFSTEELFEFYQEEDHPKPKIDFNTFQQTIIHYVGSGGSLGHMIRKYDQMFEILHVNGEKISLIV